MTNIDTQWRGAGRQWRRLSVSVMLAGTFVFLVLFLPIVAGPILPSDIPGLAQLGPAIVQAQGGLTITKVAPASVNPGELLMYTLTITNDTGQPLGPGEVAVSDQIPANTTIDCASQPPSPTGWTVPSCTGDDIVWFLFTGSLAAGASVDFSFQVTVDDPLPDNFEIVNDTYFVADQSAVYYGSPVATTIIAPQWSITKTASSATVQPGDYLTYTITVANVGGLATNGAFTITDSLPNDIVPGSVSAPEALDETASPLVWTFDDVLAPDGAGTKVVTYAVQVTSPLTAGIEIVNAGYTVFGGNVVDPATNAPVTVTVDSPVTLEISKIAGADPVKVGNTLIYTITITNSAATGPVLDVVVTDTLPAGVSYESASGNVDASNDPVIVWTLDSIPISGSAWLTVAATVDSAGSLVNQFAASAANAPLVSDSITTQAQLGITSITATNSSPNGVYSPTSFTATTNVPAGVTYSWAFADGGSGSGANPVHTYTDVGVYTAVVTAANDVSSLSTTTVVTITPGPLAGFELQAVSPQTAGAPFPITIRAIDAYGNTVTDFNDTVDISDSTGTISPLAATLLNGTVTRNFTVTRATSPDFDTIRAEYVNGSPITGTVQVEIRPAAPHLLTVTVGSTSLDICETTIVSGTLVDRWNNPVPGEPITLSAYRARFLDGGVTSIGGNTNSAGVYTATLQAIEATPVGDEAFILGRWGTTSLTDLSELISISSNTIGPTDLNLTASPNPLEVGGAVATVQATVTDCRGPLSGLPVTFSLSDLGLAAFPGPSATAVGSTNASGVATAEVTSGNISGTLTITGAVATLQEVITLSIIERAGFDIFLPLILKQQ